MSTSEQNLNKRESSRNIPFIISAIVGVLLIAGLYAYIKTRPAPPPSTGPVQQRLEGALRAGSPEFEQVKERIGVDDPEALEGASVAGGIWMRLTTTVRNFTGRTISGLEMRGAVVDLEGKPIKERYIVVVPNAGTGVTELEPNKTLPVAIVIEGFNKADVRANIKTELTGVKFK
jgi:hypothetical protein